MLDYDLLSLPQLVGYANVVASLLLTTSKNDKLLRGGSAAVFVGWALHFWLLNDATTASLALLVASRQVLSALLFDKSTRSRISVAVVYAGLFIGATAVTWRGLPSLLPLISALNATFAFMLLSGWRMRRQLLVTEAATAANGLLVGSLATTVLPLVGMGLNVWNIYRIRADERRAASPATSDTNPCAATSQ